MPGRLPPPDLELKESILRRGVALREEEVAFVLRVDVIDAPAVADDLDRLAEPRGLQRARRRRARPPRLSPLDEARVTLRLSRVRATAASD